MPQHGYMRTPSITLLLSNSRVVMSQGSSSSYIHLDIGVILNSERSPVAENEMHNGIIGGI